MSKENILFISETRSDKFTGPMKSIEAHIYLCSPPSDKNILFKYILLLMKTIYLAKTKSPSLIIGNADGFCSFIAVLSSFITKIPVVIRLGGDPWIVNERRRAMAKKSNEWKQYTTQFIRHIMHIIIFRYADGYLVVSKSICEKVAEKTEIHPKNIEIIPVPKEIPSQTSFESNCNETTILTVTNLRFKGKYVAVRSILKYMKRILENNPSLEYIIAGSGDYYGDLIKDINDIYQNPEVRCRINALGYVDNPSNLYRNSDIFLYNSYIDGMPNVLLEAQAWGLPVLSNDKFGLSEYSSRKGDTMGIDVYENRKELQYKMLALVRSPNLRSSMGYMGQKYVEQNHSNIVVGKELWGSIQNLKNNLS